MEDDLNHLLSSLLLLLIVEEGIVIFAEMREV